MNMADIPAILERIRAEEVRTVAFRFTDLRGQWQHIAVAAGAVDEALLERGVMFDGSAVAGWRDVSQSDMLLKPDLATAVSDPFSAQPSLILICNVAEPTTGLGYERCPRSVAERAETHLAASGVAERLLVAPQAEFCVFDDVRFAVATNEAFFRVDSEEGGYNSGTRYDVGNSGHRPQAGAPLVVPPIEYMADLRAEMATMLATMGLDPRQQHHDTAASQNTIAIGADGLVRSADRLQIYKYVVRSVAHSYGKSATFLPKPMAFEPGSGLQVQQALWRGDRPVFAGQGYGDISDECLHYIGGILHHARALNALTNPTSNSYRRLAPGGGAPRQLAYAALNRSAAIRLPFADQPPDKRVEARFPDPAANPYLAFAALLMAGIDGMLRQIDPGEAMDRNLYDLPPEDTDDLPTVCRTLEEALDALDQDRAFLTQGEVFTDELIDAHIALKRAEAAAVERVPHPVEYQLYYSA
jgi:glutamine synthetase